MRHSYEGQYDKDWDEVSKEKWKINRIYTWIKEGFLVSIIAVSVYAIIYSVISGLFSLFM